MWSRAPFIVVLSTLWDMLSTRRRVVFIGMLGLVFVASVLDMCGMLMIFGFIGGLRVDEGGERSGRLMRLIGHVIAHPLSDRDYALVVGGLVLAVMTIKNVLSTLVQFGLNRFLMKLNQNVSLGLFRGYLLSPYERIVATGAEAYEGRIAGIFDVYSKCFNALTRAIVDGTLIVIVVGLLLLVNPTVTLVATALFGVVGVGLYAVMQRTLIRMGREDKKYRGEAHGYLADGISGLIETRVRDARFVLINSYSKALAKTALLQRRITALKRLPRSSNEMLLTLMLVSSVYYVAMVGQQLQDLLPTLALFGFAGLRLTAATTRLNVALQGLRRHAEEFESYQQSVVEVAPQLSGSEDEALPTYLDEEKRLPKGRDGRLHHALTAEGLEFTYPEAKTRAIKKLSVVIPKGAFVSFCGPSGGGKSTLVLLLLGILKPQKGELRCDDWSIFEHIRAFHKNLGYVGQHAYIAQRTVRENIAFAVPVAEIDDAKVWKALELASADQFVRKLPKKLGHKLQEGGNNLSGGQRQRLIIARALYDDPQIVVFDEATAALDNITEREITSAIHGLSGSKTVICIAHRLSTIQGSDVIHVVEKGRISASGTYEELLVSSETFRNLAQAPLSE